jgi:predicted nucleic acid-binding protein
VVCDTGPLVSAVNRREGQRHRFAADLLARIGRDLIVPWPVLVELDLLLRSRGHMDASVAVARSCLDGIHRLESCSEVDLEFALGLAGRYATSGVDLPHLSVMALAKRHQASILTWDYRHFRTVVPDRRRTWRLLVEEHELPEP